MGFDDLVLSHEVGDHLGDDGSDDDASYGSQDGFDSYFCEKADNVLEHDGSFQG